MDQKVWLITGGSKGLGLELTKLLLANDQKVITTSRNKQELIQNIGVETGSFLPVSLSLMDEIDIQQLIDDSLHKFGRIDVLVNNAGYLMAGSVEDISDKEARDCFNVNVFGTLNMIRAVAPIMRAQHSGYIINTSSSLSLESSAFEGIYAGTKAAINAISTSLVKELAPFGIQVINSIPGILRTEFLQKESYRTPQKVNMAYASKLDQRLKGVSMLNGHQSGDPIKVAELYLKLVNLDSSPTEIFIGSGTYEEAIKTANERLANANAHKDLSQSIDF